jgi:hypothetical protein
LYINELTEWHRFGLVRSRGTCVALVICQEMAAREAGKAGGVMERTKDLKNGLKAATMAVFFAAAVLSTGCSSNALMNPQPNLAQGGQTALAGGQHSNPGGQHSNP